MCELCNHKQRNIYTHAHHVLINRIHQTPIITITKTIISSKYHYGAIYIFSWFYAVRFLSLLSNNIAIAAATASTIHSHCRCCCHRQMLSIAFIVIICALAHCVAFHLLHFIVWKYFVACCHPSIMCSVIIFQTILSIVRRNCPLKTNHFHIDLSITLHMVDANKCNYGNTQVFVVASVDAVVHALCIWQFGPPYHSTKCTVNWLSNVEWGKKKEKNQ